MAQTQSLLDLIARIGDRVKARPARRCGNCGITLDDEEQEPPAGTGQVRYCCDGCSDGGPCTC